MKFQILFSLLIISNLGHSQPKAKLPDDGFQFIWDAKNINKSQIDHAFKSIRDSLSFKVSDIEKPTKLIPENDRSILVIKLKKLGYKTISSGRGNWMEGPRMINYILESSKFICRIDRYYSNDPNDKLLHISERVAFLRIKK